jgi:hypothetical protein
MVHPIRTQCPSVFLRFARALPRGTSVRSLPRARALLPLALGTGLSRSRRRLLRDLGSAPASFRQSDRDRLLPALHLLSRAPALERAVLVLVHRPFHFSLRRLPILGHASPFEVGSDTRIFGSLPRLVYPRVVTTGVGAMSTALRTPAEVQTSKCAESASRAASARMEMKVR